MIQNHGKRPFSGFENDASGVPGFYYYKVPKFTANPLHSVELEGGEPFKDQTAGLTGASVPPENIKLGVDLNGNPIATTSSQSVNAVQNEAAPAVADRVNPPAVDNGVNDRVNDGVNDRVHSLPAVTPNSLLDPTASFDTNSTHTSNFISSLETKSTPEELNRAEKMIAELAPKATKKAEVDLVEALKAAVARIRANPSHPPPPPNSIDSEYNSGIASDIVNSVAGASTFVKNLDVDTLKRIRDLKPPSNEIELEAYRSFAERYPNLDHFLELNKGRVRDLTPAELGFGAGGLAAREKQLKSLYNLESAAVSVGAKVTPELLNLAKAETSIPGALKLIKEAKNEAAVFEILDALPVATKAALKGSAYASSVLPEIGLALDAVLTAYDTYKFVKEPSIGHGISLASSATATATNVFPGVNLIGAGVGLVGSLIGQYIDSR